MVLSVTSVSTNSRAERLRDIGLPRIRALCSNVSLSVLYAPHYAVRGRPGGPAQEAAAGHRPRHGH